MKRKWWSVAPCPRVRTVSLALSLINQYEFTIEALGRGCGMLQTGRRKGTAPTESQMMAIWHEKNVALRFLIREF